MYGIGSPLSGEEPRQLFPALTRSSILYYGIRYRKSAINR
jgi:hypothetical protein